MQIKGTLWTPSAPPPFGLALTPFPWESVRSQSIYHAALWENYVNVFYSMDFQAEFDF